MKFAFARRAGSALLIALTLSACATMQAGEQAVENNPKAVLGSVLGAGLGAGIALLAHGGPGAVIGAAVAGGVIGGAIGHHLDKKDKAMAAAAAQAAFDNNRTGQASVWNNPDSGNYGSITPTRTYQIATGQYCRQYEQTITIGGEPQQSYGTACRQSDGTWQVQPS
jgi:surface antigen